ncbi:hypothetical protein LXD69_13040 [Flavobacterium sediminilitoris]|uniref:Lipoprotein n=1 Tax=Flavobacterium sediminilitoris TaxID=2024526 RepID=A0ABY4HK94_9FLAO|nr:MULTISPECIES: hypothetical protein [Flavobacterium]UOX32960.1 hypothetical protein LXD69_13040 [Flavobacterium sediminilitoris]
MSKLIQLFFFIIFISCSAQKNISISFTIENKETLNNYLIDNEVKLEENDLYTIKDFNSFVYLNNNDKLQVPEILFFNSNGYLVKNRFNDNECSQVINEIEKINSLKFNKNVTINDWLKYISPLHQDLTEKNNIYVIINWAKFVDKFNEQSFEWYNQLKKSNSNSNLKINCILLNLDIQEKWNLTEQQKKALNII